MGIINIKHLVHKFKDNDENAEIITAIDGVDLDVEEGQFIAILGHNRLWQNILMRCLLRLKEQF